MACVKRIDPTNVPLESVARHFSDQWLFGDLNQLPFRWNPDLNPNGIWRRAHLSEDWMQFADMALRLISIGTS
jgi:hypothetical protein